METLLIGSLCAVAALGLCYRAYRATRGGPVTDVWGQAVLGVGLGLLALGVANDVIWSRWAALIFSIVFTILVMPVWVVGVLIPMRPGTIDYAFAAAYWVGLITIGVAAALS